jgi:hypothetical protein
MTTTSEAGEPGRSPSGRAAALMPGMRWRRLFPGEERELAALRRWLELLLPDCPARGDLAIVATELCTNAICHTASGHGGWFGVDITWHQQAVRVAVTDGGAPAGPQVINDPDGERGRGLLVVKGLSVRTGMCGDHRGRLVWADVPWGDAAAAEPASPQEPYEAAIGDGLAALASRFTSVPAWFGRSTLQWWALAGGKLLAAPTTQELASQLGRVLGPPPPRPPAATDTTSAGLRTAWAASRQPGRVASRPQFPPPTRRPVAQSGWDGIALAGHHDPRTPTRRPRPGATAWQAKTASGPARPATATS